MKTIEQVYNAKKLVSIIFRGNFKDTKSNFITKESYPLQVGIHQTPTKKVLSKHRHSPIKITGKIKCHEVLFVQSGYLMISFFSKDDKLITTKKISKGDGILVMDVMHQVTLSKNSKVIEIKQGPYKKLKTI